MELIFFTPMVSVTLLFLLFKTHTYKHEYNLTVSLIIFTTCTILIQLGYIYVTLKLSLIGYTYLVLRSIFRKRREHDERKNNDD